MTRVQIGYAMRSSVEENEGSYLPNCGTNCPSLFWYFINAPPCHLGQFKPSSSSPNGGSMTVKALSDRAYYAA